MEQPAPRAENAIVRLCWRALGWALFGVGLVGVFLPLLPTTIFWILAVVALRRGDPALAARIRAWPHFGAAVSDFLDHGVIASRGKRAAIIAMSVSAAILVFTLDAGIPLAIALVAIAGAAGFVLTRPGARPVAPTA